MLSGFAVVVILTMMKGKQHRMSPFNDYYLTNLIAIPLSSPELSVLVGEAILSAR